MEFIKNFFKKTILDPTFWRFVLVGVLNTIVGFGVNMLVLAIMKDANVGYWVGMIANYTVGSILSYFLNKYFTFKNSEKSAKQVARFILNIVVCMIIAYGIAKPLVGLVFTKVWYWPWQNMPEDTPKLVTYMATLVGSGLFVVINYFGQRFFAFKKEED